MKLGFFLGTSGSGFNSGRAKRGDQGWERSYRIRAAGGWARCPARCCRYKALRHRIAGPTMLPESLQRAEGSERSKRFVSSIFSVAQSGVVYGLKNLDSLDFRLRPGNIQPRCPDLGKSILLPGYDQAARRDEEICVLEVFREPGQEKIGQTFSP
ncbi:hypothetical protein LCGC14_2846400 [marine sediment metagenome]|uniref:Uncharacterized protein n=1 Tax=marine sediment metagenome TaxID=412755 RepID=A0A0F8YWD5_9ZZZZ